MSCTGDDLFLIDFDFLHASDPILDVATMESHLARVPDRTAIARDQPEAVSQIFVNEYFAHASGEWRARLPLYHAMSTVIEAARSQRDQRQVDGST